MSKSKTCIRIFTSGLFILTLVSCANTNRLYDQSVYHSENDKEYQFSVFNRTNNESMIDTMLSSACMTNDLDTIDLIITERPNIKSEVFKKGPASKISTCLVYALNSRKVTLPTVKYLVEKGSGVNSYVEQLNMTPVSALLYSASLSNDSSDIKNKLDILKYLVSKGANLSHKFNDGRTYSHFTEEPLFVSYLTSKGVNFDEKNKTRHNELLKKQRTLTKIISQIETLQQR